MNTLTRSCVLSAALVSTVFAGERYLLRAPAEEVGGIAQRHGLKILRTLRNTETTLCLVETEPGRNASALISESKVAGLEKERRLLLPEAAPGFSVPPSSRSLKAEKPAIIDYFGTIALEAYVRQPAASVIQLPAAQAFGTGAGIVAILDTGADTEHPVLKSSIAPGFDFTRGVPGGSEMADLSQSTTAILDGLQSTTAILDKTKMVALNQSTTAILDQSTTAILDRQRLPGAFGHGTMVAGLVHLVAPAAKIMPVKVFNGEGEGTLSQVIEGIYWAVEHGANVINMSFSTEEPSVELLNAINYAVSKKVVCIASAGNSGSNVKVYPAAYDAIGVGSTNNQMVRSPFSNYGDALVTVAAPGEGVISTYPGGNYAAGWGTSFSTPLVSGGAALLVQGAGSLNQSLAERAVSQAVPIGQELGAGELDLLQATLYRRLRGN